MSRSTGPLSIREWLDLIRAVDGRDPRGRRAVSRLMRHHGIDPAALGRPEHDGGQPEPPPAGDAAAAEAPDRALPEALPVLDTDSDGELDFEAGLAGAGGPRWELVGPFVDLSRAARMAGVDANAVRMSGDGNDPEATVIHPSSFCPDPSVFLGMLSVLARTTPHVRLYRVHRQGGDGPAAVLVKVFPDPGPDTMALLDAFHPDAAQQVRDATRMVADALGHLSDRTGEAGDGSVDPADPMDGDGSTLDFGSGRPG